MTSVGKELKKLEDEILKRIRSAIEANDPDLTLKWIEVFGNIDEHY